ncbi:MAG: hypothetical protein NC343_07650, partial [Muribaculum sp.]|nr:hypothetical protein [Muribaculaceae bacterium]MCM1081609.1 hypothetical protein [Muribaculum sp.]
HSPGAAPAALKFYDMGPKTATTIPVETCVTNVSTADLAVSTQKISYTLKPSKAIRRGGEKNCIRTAVSEALKANGNADVLVAMQYEIKKTKNLFGKTTIKYVIVEGYPATYKNFQTAK